MADFFPQIRLGSFTFEHGLQGLGGIQGALELGYVFVLHHFSQIQRFDEGG